MGLIRENGLLVPECIIRTDEEKDTVVPITNLGQDTIHIGKGATLTRGELCYEYKNNNISHLEYSDKILKIESGYKLKSDSNLSTSTCIKVNTGIIEEEIMTELEEKDQLLEILNEYSDLFSRTLKDLGRTDIVKMDIHLIDKNATVYYRPYRLSYMERGTVKKMVNELIEADIVEESNSSFASPIILVKKKNGYLRLCVDYRSLNKNIKREHFPIPRI